MFFLFFWYPWQLIPGNIALNLILNLGYPREFHHISNHVRCIFDEFALSLQPEHIIPQWMWLHRPVCDQIVNLQRLSLDALCELISDV